MHMLSAVHPIATGERTLLDVFKRCPIADMLPRLMELKVLRPTQEIIGRSLQVKTPLTWLLSASQELHPC